MTFNIRKLNSTDYDEVLVDWWKDWRWDAPPRDFLPDNGESGMIVLDGIIPVCAGFVYITNSKASWVDWIISNKKYTDKIKRPVALNMLIESLTNVCKANGSKYVYALIKHKSLINLYQQQGYILGDQYNKEMIKII